MKEELLEFHAKRITMMMMMTMIMMVVVSLNSRC